MLNLETLRILKGRQSVNLPREGSQWEQHPLGMSELKRGVGEHRPKGIEVV